MAGSHDIIKLKYCSQMIRVKNSWHPSTPMMLFTNRNSALTGKHTAAICIEKATLIKNKAKYLKKEVGGGRCFRVPGTGFKA